MATNYKQPGNTVTLTAPYNVSSGGGVLVGSIFGVAQTTAASGAPVEAMVTGVHTLPKTSALAISVGDLLYWDDTDKVVNKTEADQPLVGVAVSAAANPSSAVDVRLNGAFVAVVESGGG